MGCGSAGTFRDWANNLIDYDEIARSNVNRQIHALTETFGEKKIAVMAKRAHEINPECQVHAIDDFINMENMQSLLERGYDYVIDAIDSIKFKAAMINHCRRNKIPIIATGGAGGLSDPSMIKIDDLSRTYNDPLAAKVRRQLREEYGFTRNSKRTFGVECVFSSQQQVYPRRMAQSVMRNPGFMAYRWTVVLAMAHPVAVTATFGFVAVARAINKILKKRLQQ